MKFSGKGIVFPLFLMPGSDRLSACPDVDPNPYQNHIQLFKRSVPYRGSGGTVPLVSGDDLHDVVVGVGGEGVAPSVEPKGRPPRQPQVKRQVGRFLKIIKLVKNNNNQDESAMGWIHIDFGGSSGSGYAMAIRVRIRT